MQNFIDTHCVVEDCTVRLCVICFCFYNHTFIAKSLHYGTNYRPISNLNTISKTIERLVLRRLLPHLLASANFNPLQSAYRSGHSTETAHHLLNFWNRAALGLFTAVALSVWLLQTSGTHYLVMSHPALYCQHLRNI